ncbi:MULTISPECIES: TIGR03086 family metal-binding protein [Actinomadura]|uniref:TIGR03086 family metal-binding protein n=1 Tax=Actinomadura yumaensis TaxID=111807 RepID=A0ABW2CJY2_9ACTN|nr:TIGR03086 family metal-binding protein [Actinomadura sp. J1-007]MWK37853.1 TIGR03086 family protein [Actinomadura sp. J1-007]
MIDLRPACRSMIDVLAGVAGDQLAAATPCAEYSVGDLVGHVDQVAVGFAALARKESAREEADEPAAADPGDGGRDGVPEHLRAVPEHLRALGEAWTDPAAWQGATTTGGLELPNEVWGRIALTELVVHGWDIAKATGQRIALPDGTLRACYDHVVSFVPNAPVPALWGPAVEVPADAPLLDRIVAVTGRNP